MSEVIRFEEWSSPVVFFYQYTTWTQGMSFVRASHEVLSESCDIRHHPPPPVEAGRPMQGIITGTSATTRSKYRNGEWCYYGHLYGQGKHGDLGKRNGGGASHHDRQRQRRSGDIGLKGLGFRGGGRTNWNWAIGRGGWHTQVGGYSCYYNWPWYNM